MKLPRSLVRLFAAVGCKKLADRYAASCPECRDELADADKLDALLRQPASSSPSGRAPVDVIAAVRAATTTPEPAAKRFPATAVWACATLAVGLLIVVLASSNEAPAPTTVQAQPKPLVEPVPLPTAAAAASETATELSLAGFESEFALLAADFRRSTGRE